MSDCDRLISFSPAVFSRSIVFGAYPATMDSILAIDNNNNMIHMRLVPKTTELIFPQPAI